MHWSIHYPISLGSLEQWCWLAHRQMALALHAVLGPRVYDQVVGCRVQARLHSVDRLHNYRGKIIEISAMPTLCQVSIMVISRYSQ